MKKLGSRKKSQTHFSNPRIAPPTFQLLPRKVGKMVVRLGWVSAERFIDIAAETAAVTNFWQYPVYLGFDPAVIDESKLTERGRVGHYYREDRVPHEDKAKVPKQSTEGIGPARQRRSYQGDNEKEGSRPREREENSYEWDAGREEW